MLTMILPKCLFEATYFDEFEIQYRERSLKPFLPVRMRMDLLLCSVMA